MIAVDGFLREYMARTGLQNLYGECGYLGTSLVAWLFTPRAPRLDGYVRVAHTYCRMVLRQDSNH